MWQEKKYININIRQMTMERIESQQHGSVTDSVAENESSQMQTLTGQTPIPTFSSVVHSASGTLKRLPSYN